MELIDPAGQFSFELPLGWGVDMESSHVIEVHCRRWDGAEALVAVRALPPATPPAAEDDDWRAAVRKGSAMPWAPSVAGTWTALRLDTTQEGQPPRRVLLVRGGPIDVRCTWRGGSEDEAAFDVLARSLEVPARRRPPRAAPQQEVMSALAAGMAKAREGGWAEALPLALRARDLARDTYLASVAQGALFPELPALLAAVDALVLAARASGDLMPLRDAEHLAVRSLRTLAGLPFVPPARRAEMFQGFSERLAHVEQLTRAIAGDAATARTPPHVPGVGLAALRTQTLLERARAETERRGPIAAWYCDAALSDLFGALGSLAVKPLVAGGDAPAPASNEPRSEAMEHFASLSPEERGALGTALLRRVLLEDTQLALSRWMEIQAARDDMAQEAAASEALVRVSQALAHGEKTPGGALMPPADHPIEHAKALLVQASSLASLADPLSLTAAEALLDHASRLLDGASEEGPVRAVLCSERAKLLYARRLTGGALEVIERGLRAAGDDPRSREAAEALLTMRPLFLLHVRDPAEAIRAAEALVQPPEPDDPGDVRLRASRWLNLGVIQLTAGDPAAALASLLQALRRDLRAAPFGEGLTRTLVVAATAVGSSDADLALELNLAAAAALDVRRAGITADATRIDFDESRHHRDTYAELVLRAIESGQAERAAEAADRSRARALASLLSSTGAPRAASMGEPPPLEGIEPRVALRTAAQHIVRAADDFFQQAGYGRPLRAGEIRSLIDSLGAPALLVQPVRDRLALILLRPSEPPFVALAPSPLAAVLAAAQGVRGALGIAEAQREAAPARSAASSADLPLVLEQLWTALVMPVLAHLRPDEPVLVVPYRELTLVPFALLGPAGGPTFGAEHPLAAAPSLAALQAIRARREGDRAKLTRAYVAGDPAADPHLRLRPLPAAREEARAVQAALLGAGLPESGVVGLTGSDATLASYRRGAFRADVVHLACHGDLREPASASCLHLAHDGTDGGTLTASAVPSVPLDDALVFLSACRTGQGRVTADGVVGLGRAFLAAGARVVIQSSWSVADTAAAALAGRFYEALLGGDRPSVAEALRRSMQAVHTDLAAGRIPGGGTEPLPPDPVHYAPFVAWGDALSMRYT